MATETASVKAREEWRNQKSEQAQKRKPKSPASAQADKSAPAKKAAVKKVAESNAAKAAAEKKKNQMMAGQTKSVPVDRDSRTYQEIYRSIPFSRTEYNANPGYRHLATMEIMLGQLHPVIVAPVAPQQPQRNLNRPLTIRIVPAYRSGYRPGYRPWSSYPWH